jgi:hypothetical protein
MDFSIGHVDVQYYVLINEEVVKYRALHPPAPFKKRDGVTLVA